MSWLFSQALVAEYLPGSRLDGEPSVPLSAILTQQAYLLHGKTTAFSRLSRFGMTFKLLTDDLGEDLLTSYLADFRASTSVIVAAVGESANHEAGCGNKCRASFAKFDQDSFSWKTSQLCFFEEWTSFSGTWPRWGLMRGGACWELPTWVGIKPGSGFGLWPTLKASDGEQRTSNLAYFERRLKIAPDLPVIVALSTPPTAKGFYGRLNPDWCEWLTGWRIKWTEFAPLETGKIRELQLRHGGY